MDWDKYVEEQRKQLDEQNKKVQEMLANAGIDVNSLPKVDLAMIDEATKQELMMSHGIDLEKVSQKPPKNASNWRMKTKARMV